MPLLKRILLAAVPRFALSMVSIAIGILVAFDGVSPGGLPIFGVSGLAGLATVGYALTLWTARKHLRADAGIGGRRDLVAGGFAIILLVMASILTQGVQPAARMALSSLSGVVSAVAMYFPWFERRSRNAETVLRADA